MTNPSDVPTPDAVAQLVALHDSSLALVGSLLIVTIESPAADLTFGVPEVDAASSTGVLASAAAAFGQSLSGPDGNGFQEDDLNEAAAEPQQPPEATGASSAMSWERFVIGT